MADKNDGGDKTEKPTQKKLDDARKKGDVAKSKEVTSAIVLIVWLGLGALTMTYAATRIAALYEQFFAILALGWEQTGFVGVARDLGARATEATLMLVAMLLIPAAAVGLLTDFLQAGPVLAFEKVKPNLEHLNPAEGVKRMFSMDNLVEVLKAVIKTALLFVVGWILIKSALPEIVLLARSPDLSAQVIGDLAWGLTLKLLGWTVALFLGLSLLDWVYQRWSFEKKMRMSIRDIKQEMKESEGDPHLKAHRRQTAQEWAQSNNVQAARNANVLLVNPTHIAIAIEYDRETCPVPMIAAKGEDEVARAMRQAAEEEGVPIVRNIPLARDMLARGEVGEVIPSDLFDVIAEVILWAREVRAEVRVLKGEEDPDPSAAERRRTRPPGEDMTRYPGR